MTNRIMAIIEKSATDIVRAPILRADVRREGARSIDTAELTIPAGFKVAINDIVSYIQDDVPVTNLFAVWNFQGSYRDEGGYHHDGTRSTTYLTNQNPDEGFILPNHTSGMEHKYRANYGLDFNAAGQEITVADDPSSNHTNTNSLLDFRDQFDIIINFKNQQSSTLSSHFNGATNDTMILFAKHDGTRGVEVGLKRTTSPTAWKIYAKLDSTTFTGNGTLVNVDTTLGHIQDADTGTTRMIRFYRDHDNVVRLLLDNQLDGTNCKQIVVENATRCTAPLYIGTNKANVDNSPSGSEDNYDFKGHIYQIRVYCGGYLEHDHVETLHQAGAQQMTQKISGNVWSMEDKLKKIKLQIKSRSRSLLDTNITYGIIGNNIPSGSTTANEPATHIKNVFEGGQDMSDILKTIVFKVDPTFVFFRHSATDSNNPTDADGKFMADGNFVKNVEILMIMSRKGFLTLPTKTFVWEFGAEEQADGNLFTGYTFSDKRTTGIGSEYQIYSRGDNDFNIINDLEIFGDLQQGYTETDFGNPTGNPINPFSNTFAHSPKNLQLVIGQSADTAVAIPPAQYWVDFNSKQLYLTSTAGLNSSHQVIGKYNFDITTDTSNSMGGSDRMTRHYKSDPTAAQEAASIAKYGRRSVRIYMPQLLREGDFNTIGQKIIDDYSAFYDATVQNPKHRYRVVAPFLLNCLRENLGIKLSSTKMKFTNATGVQALPDIILPVKSIRWQFPEMITTIEVGDYYYDLYDYYKITSDAATSVTGSLIQTRSST